MSLLYEVKNGFIPEISFGKEPEFGWLRLGSHTERMWGLPSPESRGRFTTLGLVVDASHISDDPEHRARMDHQPAYRGERPIEFMGVIPTDQHSFHDVAIRGLLFRSGFYRGSVEIESSTNPLLIAEEQGRFIACNPHTFAEKLAR